MSADLRRTLLLAVAMLRRDEAIDYLLSLVEKGKTVDARDALSALGVYRENPTVRERILQAAKGRSELEEVVRRTLEPK